ncbi:fumarylacetoacetase [Actinoplanes sp. OR16]|uniref:fumarylacetoacetase n=1 Tax=Actinoplanes sp. OR16 TaxID=946334 RepID=UPI000F706C27|nr:fumarylacetoacetase [Actinoplanes sp. OR16]BBH69808.1 fumarylacetoacetase [Actinoplanes sp. OR16]
MNRHSGIGALPYGIFSTPDEPHRRAGVALGDQIIDLPAAVRRLDPSLAAAVTGPTLDALLAAGPAVWSSLRASLITWVTDEAHRDLLPTVPAADAVMHLPFTVADYVDFYASEQHATNLGRILRPGQEPLTANWKHLPIGYHGRAGTVVVSGTDIVRPSGLRPGAEFGASQRLDIEAELGFVVGAPSTLGTPVPLADFDQHVFGVCLVNDWSARDIQAFEYVPLGPFLGKSFATSVSPWIVPLAALEHARVPPPVRDVPLSAYLDDEKTPSWGLDVRLEIRLNGQVISTPTFEGMYWTPAQMLAHMTVNGAALRTGDLYASGTISGGSPGSLIELSWNGQEPLHLADGSARAFLHDGDEVVISAVAPGENGTLISLGEVSGRILGAR